MVFTTDMSAFTSFCTDIGFTVLYFVAMGAFFGALKAWDDATQRRQMVRLLRGERTPKRRGPWWWRLRYWRYYV